MATIAPFAWAALSGHPPKPEGSRLLARGVDGDSARQATILMAMEAPFAQAAALLPFDLQILRRGLDMRRSALVNQWRSWRWECESPSGIVIVRSPREGMGIFSSAKMERRLPCATIRCCTAISM